MKCEEKHQYSTKARAVCAAAKHQSESLRLRPYKCRTCGYWHLTHLPKATKAEACR